MTDAQAANISDALMEFWTRTYPRKQVTPVAFQDGVLTVECVNEAWELQTRLLGGNVIQKINELLSHPTIRAIRVRLAPARILVTGSRTWPSVELLIDALDEVWHDATQIGHPGLTIVHGGADGADKWAKGWAIGNGLPHEAHPADWSGPCTSECPPDHRRSSKYRASYCPLAGHYRNQLMVDLGAAMVVAFHHRNSSGTADAIRRAEKAGLPVRRIIA